MPFRLCAAVWAGKTVAALSRMLGHRGSSLPGHVALRIYPGTLRALARRAKKGVILVTGTNGKTTTNNMIAQMLSDAGHSVIINREGANMLPGIATAFVRSAGVNPAYSFDYAVLEVDEASFPRVVEQVNPDVVVVTNFFRDQLDRYGELDQTISFIRDALRKLPKTRLVLNGDDPLVAQLGRIGPETTYFGLAPHGRVLDTSGASREARFCPLCGTDLHYSFYHYSQLGLYECTGCGFERPEPAVQGWEAVSSVDETTCRVVLDGRDFRLNLPTQGFYNLYNALAALCAGSGLRLEPETMLKSLYHYKPEIGRLQHFRHRGRPLYLNLVKNPAGFNESLAILLAARGSKDLYIAINDNAADGRDISWLWDVDVELLAEPDLEINRFLCSGERAAEMAVRLKYAGVSARKIGVEPRVQDAVGEMVRGGGDAAYLLATYTALWPTEKALSTMSDGK
ncbi:MAG: MurT ligase domain-containing protein [Eubacteriales bacterium]|nr:DUF1727 domain-containing protein [Bacillota bacterium]MBU4597888.1 DUF1727 domain-containing protein [Pseudomonadota bacterium]MBV1728332.1 DUF1727 domain-containing protein [Desulforudis sp.]MDQ7790101.1 MurT ligase domain-containing protein [Clostridia bacterium]MDZ4042693.1 MurT ligase domain-containing protein [Eubacteriales bacterium]